MLAAASASGASDGSVNPGEKNLKSRHLLVIYHAEPTPVTFTFPREVRDLPWRLFVNTAQPSPADIDPLLKADSVDTEQGVEIAPQSVVCFVSEEE